MEKHPGIINGGVIRKDGSTTPATAGDVLAIVIEKFAEAGILLLTPFKAIAGKRVKQGLDDGVDAETLVVATTIAFKRREPQNVLWIAQDLIMMRGGMAKLSRHDYEKAMQDEIEIGSPRG